MDIVLKPFAHREADVAFPNIDLIESWEIPEKPGAYIFASTNQFFQYPNGKSRVMYIGKAKNLRARIRTHIKVVKELRSLKTSDRNQDWYYARHQYISKFGGRLYCFTKRGTQDEQNLESMLLEEFYDRYYALPVGNGAFSYKKFKKML